MASLTKRTIDAAKADTKEYFLWCGATPGFGLRVYPSGSKIFIAQVRVGRATRRVKIGAYGPFTVDQARDQAKDIIRAAAEGRDPQREKTEAKQALTVGELCDRYLEAARAGLVMTRFRKAKRPSTIAIDEGRVSRHIKPLIGTIVARDLSSADVQRMADDITRGKTAGTFKTEGRGKAVVAGGPSTAARVVELLGGIYSWAEKREHVSGIKPVRNIETARSDAKDRVLSAAELKALGQAAARADALNAKAADALRLIALTGLRREEACGLKWSEVDLAGQCLRLDATKTGRSLRPLGRAALAVLEDFKNGTDWVFPNRTNSGSAELKRKIAAIFDDAGLADARSHDLRRTFASFAAEEGYGDGTIGEMLGHARRGVTAKHYIRRPDAALIQAADKISARIASLLTWEREAASIRELRGTAG
ncbi:integrase family protein [Terrihabitans rhizophilus]|uniref:Integrase family protein n=1 Tax=Terrihabitans rhizophilus TaxID=3092662 RepID=A0ABU4RQQ8_9HYPH|nr:integrase family protein [Terrihabitans sp. PJ23]MDX6807172.1 integrase family protein [Terrihabitans sp. PJ23]